MYGFTEILPGRITTDRIVSSDGTNYLDLLNNAMRIGDANRYLAWNVVSGLLQITNANVVANGKFSTKDPNEGFRLDFEGAKLDVFSLSEVLSVGQVEGTILLINAEPAGEMIGAPTAVFSSNWGDNAKMYLSGATLEAGSGNNRRISIDWSDARIAGYKDFLIYIIKGLPQMDDPTYILESGQLYIDSNNFLKIAP